MFDNFYGNDAAAATLRAMIDRQRIPQTILLAGSAGVGKATLVRRFAAALLGDSARIERDDLSLPENVGVMADREKWPAEKRNEDPLLFASHPDFVTFAPDGPLRQISIPAMRHLKDLAQYKPLKGSYRIFLLDQLQRANEQAAASLLKTLEEPPAHLVLFATAENAYDLLPTIRSRAVILYLAPLDPDAMKSFAQSRAIPADDRRLALAGGCPGQAVSLDLETYDRRRALMLKLIGTAAGRSRWEEWAKAAEGASAARSEKLDGYLEVLSRLLEDMLLLHGGRTEVRNADIRTELETLAEAVDFTWLNRAVRKLDETIEFSRRNIQKTIALDAFAAGMRPT